MPEESNPSASSSTQSSYIHNTQSAQLYTSKFSIPYSPHSPLNTLDIHIPTSIASLSSASAAYSIIYIHGGAFRDPLLTSRSILPSLPALFNLPLPPRAIASLNYRLSPYPSHPTLPSRPDDPSRNVRWPAHIEDVCSGVSWLTAHRGNGEGEDEGDGDGERGDFGQGTSLVLVGHSVGATMALKILLGGLGSGREGGGIGIDIGTAATAKIKAIVSLSGIADFAALRDAHLESREAYDAFCTAAFGEEDEGKWELARVFPRHGQHQQGEGEGLSAGLRDMMDKDVEEEEEESSMEVVVLGQGKADELVEWEQVEFLREGLRRKGWKEAAERNDENGNKGEEYGYDEKEKRAERRGGRNFGGGIRFRKNRTRERKRKRMAVVELEGGHDDVWEQGREIARCVELAIEMLVGKEGDSGKNGIQ